jgi:pentose-5-phosphate-3-epimerase
LLAQHGVDVAVMGTAFFHAEDQAALVREAHGL